MNCWEYKNCGREVDGAKAGDLGVCPAATFTSYNNMNHGKNAGRYCWKVAGTLCGGNIQGSFASKMGNCIACDFYRTVQSEEGGSFTE